MTRLSQSADRKRWVPSQVRDDREDFSFQVGHGATKVPYQPVWLEQMTGAVAGDRGDMKIGVAHIASEPVH